MPEYNSYTRQRVADINLGLRVDRTTANLPQTTSTAIFTVATGRVMVRQIVGEVTTIIANLAVNAKIKGNPTTGTTTDWCANLNLQNNEVGTLYGITGTVADAMQASSSGGLPGQAKGIIAPIGTIEVETDQSRTGQVKWSIFYVPIDDGATITAA